MCYGGLDTKYILRDIEARMKPVAFEQDISEEAAPAFLAGLVVRLQGAVKRMLRKGALHV